MLLPESYIVLSSVQLEQSVSLITRNISLRKVLNKIGSSTEPCRTPKGISFDKLYAWLTLLPCFLRER